MVTAPRAATAATGSGAAWSSRPVPAATLSDSILTHNRADGGEKGTGGRDGQGVGGAVHGRGTFAFDFVSVIKKNHASTSSDDIDP